MYVREYIYACIYAHYLYMYIRKEGNVLFNDALNTFYGYMALDIW